MKIYQQKSSRVFMIKHNQIPFNKFLNSKYIEQFVKLFNFNNIVPQQDPSTGDIASLNFMNGLFNTSDQKELSILRIGIESRKIVCDITGESKYLAELYQIIKEFISNVAEEKEQDFLVPILEANESEIVSHLEISPLKLFPSSFVNKVIPKGLKSASYEFAQAKLGALQTIFQIDYVGQNLQILNDHRINLVRKEFLIQTAIGRAIDEQVFASKAPMTTDEHLKFLESLEKELK